MTHALLFVSVLFPLVLTGLLLPWMGRNRRGILFGVTVSLEFAASAEAQAALRRYRRTTSFVVLLVIAGAALVLWFGNGSAPSILIATIAGLVIEFTTALILWSREHRRMLQHEAAIPLERHAELTTPDTSLPLIATAAALFPLALSALWLYRNWNLIPSTWPQHWDLNGVPNGFATRSTGGVFGPLLLGAIVLLLVTAISAFIGRASGPHTSQRARVLAPLAVLAWLLAAMFTGIGLLPLIQPISSAKAIGASLALFAATIANVIWLVWRTGIGSASVNEPYDGTPDAKWHAAGIFYYNPADAAVIVPKRFGWGWTLNFARPLSWLYIGGVLAVALALTLLPLIAHK